MSWAMYSGASAVMPTAPILMCCSPLAAGGGLAAVAALAAGLALAAGAELAAGLGEALAGAAAAEAGLAAALLAAGVDAGAALPPQALKSSPTASRLGVRPGM